MARAAPLSRLLLAAAVLAAPRAARAQAALPLTMCTCTGSEAQRLVLDAPGTNLSLIRAGAPHAGLCLTAGALGGACQGACVSLGACATATLWNVSGTSTAALTIFAATGAGAAPGVAGLRLSGPMAGSARLVEATYVNSGVVASASQLWDASSPDGGLRSNSSATLCVSAPGDCCAQTSSPGVECSGHGTCDAQSGVCACAGCYIDDAGCSIGPNPGRCNGGSCDPSTGSCMCTPCLSGPTCATARCAAHGSCTGSGPCTCDACYVYDAASDTCVPKDCGPESSCDAGSGVCLCSVCRAIGGDGRCSVNATDCGDQGYCVNSGGVATCACRDPQCFSLGDDKRCTSANAIKQCGVGQCVAGACECPKCTVLNNATGSCDGTALDCGAYGVCPLSGPLKGWDDSGADSFSSPRLLPPGPPTSFQTCQDLCTATPGCQAWSYVITVAQEGGAALPTCNESPLPACFLKQSEPATVENGCRITGEPGPAGSGPGGFCECADACGVLGRDGRCSARRNCGAGGNCSIDLGGACVCIDACWAKDAATGACSIEKKCNAPRGVCSGTDGSCFCDPNYCATGPDCAGSFSDCGPGAAGACSEGSGCTCLPCWGKDAAGLCSVPQTCSSHGTCSGADGSCVCDACFDGDQCDAPEQCSNRGTCSPDSGACVCNAGYSALSRCRLCDACHAGTTCAASLDAQLCNAPGGVCTTNANGSFAGCACDVTQCAAGPTCADAIDCGPGAAGPCTPGIGCSCAPCFSKDAAGLCTVAQACSGHGECGGPDGACACDSCFIGDACEAPQLCSSRGSCSPGTGACVCNAHYSALSFCRDCDACHSGPTCTASLDVQLCGAPNGACTTAVNGSFAGCVCSGGFSGADCSVPPAAAAAAGNAGSGAAAGAVAAGVLAPLLLAVAAAWALRASLRKRFPGLPFAEAAARAANELAGRALSSGRYTPVTVAPATLPNVAPSAAARARSLGLGVGLGAGLSAGAGGGAATDAAGASARSGLLASSRKAAAAAGGYGT